MSSKSRSKQQQRPPAADDSAAAIPNPNPVFAVEKIYLKDVSFESPRSPHVFNENNPWQVNINLGQAVERLNDAAWEVILTVRLTCALPEGEESAAYVAEVRQAGVFALTGFEPATLDALLGIQCPNILYPYARLQIDELIRGGGFPQFALQPINFEAIYAENIRQRQRQAAGEPAPVAA